MTLEKAREIISLQEEKEFDPFEALMDPDYFVPGYEEAQKTVTEYENAHGVNERTGKIYYKKPCRKCGGSGHLMCYDHIDKGRCWNCGGSGYIEVYE